MTNEQLWTESADTAKGREEHQQVHTTRIEKRGNEIKLYEYSVFSDILGISGKCDCIEAFADPGGCMIPGVAFPVRLYPVEYKHGSALETVGLDPAAGFLHTLRPGRASFALDLMEELRAPLCDRLTLTLFNKAQLSQKDFDYTSQAVFLNEKGRRTVLNTWRNRKQEDIQHPFLKEKIKIGLIPYTQAMLFARVLRGDLDCYPPFVWR